MTGSASAEDSSETSLHGNVPHTQSNYQRSSSTTRGNYRSGIGGGYINDFGAGRGRGRNRSFPADPRSPFVDDDEENQLIDQFDEEWNR